MRIVDAMMGTSACWRLTPGLISVNFSFAPEHDESGNCNHFPQKPGYPPSSRIESSPRRKYSPAADYEPIGCMTHIVEWTAGD
jgi:hypothetical protein